MKYREGFVSNSSSCAFIIINTSDKPLTIVDFVRENPQLVEEWNEGFGYEDTQEEMIESAEQRLKYESETYTYKPGKREYSVFGDEEGDTIGRVFDYILRDGGSSENWEWRFEEYLR